MRGEANGEEGRQQPQPLRGEEEQDDEDERQQGQGPPQQRTAPRPSSGQQQQQPPPVAMRNVGYVGKHRLSAAITRLDQELQSLQVRASLSLLTNNLPAPPPWIRPCFQLGKPVRAESVDLPLLLFTVQETRFRSCFARRNHSFPFVIENLDCPCVHCHRISCVC